MGRAKRPGSNQRSRGNAHRFTAHRRLVAEQIQAHDVAELELDEDQDHEDEEETDCA